MQHEALRGVTLRHLRLVSVLGRELNLSRSAAVLHTTQPALSRSLAGLEQIVGTRLFDRSTKHVALTAAGFVLLRHAERILAEIEGTAKELSGMRSGMHGDLRIGMLAAISGGLLAAALVRLRGMLPELTVSVHTLGLAALHDALVGGRIDLMLAPAELTLDLERIQVSELYVETASIVAASDHALASASRITARQLAAQPWVLPAHDVPLRGRVNRMLALHRAEVLPHGRDVEADSFLLALELARTAGMLCAVPSRLLEEAPGVVGVTALRTRFELLKGPMCAMRLRASAQPVACDAFVHAFHEAAGEGQRSGAPFIARRV